MKKTMRGVRSLVLRNYLGSALTSFLVFIFLFMMFGFDMEDQIFDNQVSTEADRLVENLSQNQNLLDTKAGITRALEMNYYIGKTGMPDWMSNKIKDKWSNGTYELFAEEQGHFHLAVRTLKDGQKFYMSFNARPYIRSTFHIQAYVVIILVIGGMVVVVTGYFIHRISRKLSKPMEDVAMNISAGNTIDLSATMSETSVTELKALLEALHIRDTRIQSLLDRESQFNRDASHELRTPLSVAMGAVEILEEDQGNLKAFHRLKSSMVDMQSLTEGILWLSRDPDKQQCCAPKDLSQNIIEAHKNIIEARPIQVNVYGSAASSLPVPKPVGLVIIGNLIRNAFSYTEEGSVTINVADDHFSVADTGIGFGNKGDAPEPSEQGGFGIGLSLVNRLCEHFGLTINTEENPAGGSIITISWH